MISKLSADEVIYHQKVSEYLLSAQSVHKFWIEHLANKYSLKPNDIITLEGSIKRVETNSFTNSSS
jgi:hypothetical protein